MSRDNRDLSATRRVSGGDSVQHRRFGRTGWEVSAVGYGMWGVGGEWKESDDDAGRAALARSVELGCNFFDTALAYGDGHSERLLGELVRANTDRKLYLASKIPPKNRQWPARKGVPIADVFPPDYIRAMAERSLENLGVDSLDLMQFHVWNDEWATDDGWKKAARGLTDEGLVTEWGVSVNRWEPANCLETLRTGSVDAVQVIYNIFDQNPEDDLFPVCRELDIAVIARVPFDEGGLSGTLTKDATWPEGDWRNTYFVPENLVATVDRADALKPLVPDGMDMPEMALRFILSNEDVATVIPGMRKVHHVEANIRAGDGARLPNELMADLRPHRWDRAPTDWSQ
jgi:aryl-alcohol dehydrogenase-like predicted oxidoreductase